MIVTVHARKRWIQRVDPTATLADAAAAIGRSARAIEAAARFGCDTVILGNGARLKLDGDTVMTVLPADRRPCGGRCDVHSPAMSLDGDEA